MALGVGLEWNMNSGQHFAGGAALGVDFDLFRSFGTGFSLIASRNLSVLTALEPSAMFRWYPLGKNHAGLFAQADAGVFLYYEDHSLENMQIAPIFLGGVRAGIRLPLGRLFYIEPYARAGYPFTFGIGVAGGTRLTPVKKHPEIAPVTPAITPYHEHVVETVAETPYEYFDNNIIENIIEEIAVEPAIPDSQIETIVRRKKAAPAQPKIPDKIISEDEIETIVGRRR